jgi:ParB family transcriptional regulator, chromosome partitioning protein
MARKNIFDVETPSPPPLSANEDHRVARPLLGVARPQRAMGALGAISKSLDTIHARAKRAEEIEGRLGNGETIIELDPELLDPSPFPDRLPDDNDAAFHSLREGIERDGQKLPIQVRPHPQQPGRFQVVFGHRRWRAARSLGRPLRAVVANLSDAELVVAQGIENTARQDLTWIERALFAWRMDEAGLKAKDIRAALGIDDPELARMRAVTRVISPELTGVIGRAPAIGRRRWIELADAITADRAALPRIRKTLSADKVLAVPSDEKFSAALAASKPVVTKPASPLTLISPSGKSVGSAIFGPTGVKLAVDKKYAPAFQDFFKEEVGPLIQKFFALQGEE